MTIRKTLRVFLSLTAFVLVNAILTGCDGDSAPASDEPVTIEGRVTDESGFGKRATAIEGAVVTASNVDADGSLRTLSGQATTDVNGIFVLKTEGAGETIIVEASKQSFNSQVLVIHDLSAKETIRAMPMTIESEAEAAVYVEAARNGSAGDLITAADVAAYVNQRLAAEWKNGGTSAVEIVAVLEASARAEENYFAEDEEADVDKAALREVEDERFLTLQADLHAAADVAAQADAVRRFERAMIDAYGEAGASIEAQAKARQTGRAALLRFDGQGSTEARFALRQQVEIMTALATCQAIEAAFEAEGSSGSRINALADARMNLLAGLRAASDESAMAVARADYEADVKAELAAELEIDAALLTVAETELNIIKATLDSSLAGAGSVNAVVSAFATYYQTAESSASATLAASGGADLGATVLVLLGAG